MSLTPKLVKATFMEAVEEAYRFIVSNEKRVAMKYNIPEKERSTYPFVCWSESDLRTLIVYYLSQKLSGKIFIHTEVVLKNIDKFKYDSKDQRELWLRTVEKLLEYKGRKLCAGDIDIAVTSADTDTIPFLLVAEIKYFHYPTSGYGRKVLDEVEKAYGALEIMKQEGLAHEIAMVIGDHYYHRDRPKTARRLKEFAEGHSEDVVYLKI